MLYVLEVVFSLLKGSATLTSPLLAIPLSTIQCPPFVNGLCCCTLATTNAPFFKAFIMESAPVLETSTS